MDSGVRGLLVLVVCAASPARYVPTLVGLLVAQGWRVRVVATPQAQSWLDADAIEALTGFIPAVSGAGPGPDGLGHPDAVLVAPATLNTIGKLASMINDCLALDVIHTAVGDSVPVVLFPHVKGAFAAHSGYESCLSVLRGFGIEVVEEGAVCDGGCPAGRHWPTVTSAVADPSALRLAGIVIRPETIDDVVSTARAHLAAWRSGYQDLLPPEVLDGMTLEQQVAKRIRALAGADGGNTLIAARGKLVLGHVTVRAYPHEPQVGQVWSCYTDPRAWGSGISGRLLRQGLALLPQAVVRLWVLDTNARAIAFYRRHGFQPDGQRTSHDIGGTAQPIIRMTLDRTVHNGQ